MQRCFKAALFGCLVGVIGLTASFFHFSHRLEEDIDLSLLFHLRGAIAAPADVVIVSIDRDSSERLKVSHDPDRWPRSLHAALIDELVKAGARIIIFDVYFIEPRSADQDSLLAQAMQRAANVVLAAPLRVREVRAAAEGKSTSPDHKLVTIVRPIASIAGAALASAPFVLPRLPVRVNYYWTFQREAGESPTFPVVALQTYATPILDDLKRLLLKARPDLQSKLAENAAPAAGPEGPASLIRRFRMIFESDPTLMPDMIEELSRSPVRQTDPPRYKLLLSLIKLYGGANHRYLNYYGPPRTFRTLSFHDVLDSANREPLKLSGKVVFVGLSEILLAEKEDSFHTVFSQANGVFVSGVEIAATAFANLLDDKPVHPIATPYYILVILIWGIVVGLIFRALIATLAVPAVLAMCGLYLFGAKYSFTTDGTWFPLVIPLFLQAPVGFLGAALWSYCETNRERRNVRDALSYYVPSDVVNQLARNRIDMRRGGETVYGVCLFADAAGYTSFSERFSPGQLREIMHRFFEATFAPIHQHGGLVVDLKGDSILAIWQARQPEAILRQRACHAALDLAKAVHAFNAGLDGFELPIRIGLHAGEIFLGNLGAGGHYEYGVTGDTVNTASRMDGLNKYLGTQILVSEDVIDHLEGMLTREAGSFLLQGKSQPLQVFELLCPLDEAGERQKAACELFAEGLGAFRQRSWAEARRNFQRCTELLGSDRLSQYYLKLCDEYLDYPPGATWNSVIHMQEK